jgi:hypothetical protein
MKSTLRSAALASLALVSFSAKATENGLLDDWGQSALLKEFYWCRIQFHRGENHIISITLEHKDKASGNAYFHAGECNSIMLSVARGPGSRVNFKQDVATDDIWVDKVTGNRLKENENGYLLEDQSDTSLLVGELKNGGQDFVITEAKFGSN